jgi:hypothetical protein
MTSTAPSDAALRRAVAAVAILNLAYFGAEFSVALAIGSVALFADSVDFLEDASINLLILMSLGWSAGTRARVGMALAAILLVPGLATLWTAWQKFSVPVPPAPLPLSLAGAGALAVNLTCALLLVRFPARCRQPHPGGVPLGPQRRLRQRRDRRGGARHGGDALGLARPHRRPRHRGDERRRGARGLRRGAARACRSGGTLARDDFSSRSHPALPRCLSMIFSENR